jgi:protein-tyrosine phosphatase
MRQIDPHPVWLGHAGDGRAYRAILDAGIEAIVQVALEEAALQPPRELLYFRFPLFDGSGNNRNLLSLAITTVANLLEKQVPTLVCCGAGMSRSPAVLAAAMSMVFQEPPDECLKQITEHQPHDVLPTLWIEIKQLLESDRM